MKTFAWLVVGAVLLGFYEAETGLGPLLFGWEYQVDAPYSQLIPGVYCIARGASRVTVGRERSRA